MKPCTMTELYDALTACDEIFTYRSYHLVQGDQIHATFVMTGDLAETRVKIVLAPKSIVLYTSCPISRTILLVRFGQEENIETAANKIVNKLRKIGRVDIF